MALTHFARAQILSSGRKGYFKHSLFRKTNHPSVADLCSLVPVHDGCLLHCNHHKHPLCYLYYHALFTPCKMVCQNKILKNPPPAFFFCFHLVQKTSVGSTLPHGGQNGSMVITRQTIVTGYLALSSLRGRGTETKYLEFLLSLLLSETTLPIRTKWKQLTFG